MVVEPGTTGEVLKVLRDESEVVQYHVRFPGRPLQVPESVLVSATVVTEKEEAAD